MQRRRQRQDINPAKRQRAAPGYLVDKGAHPHLSDVVETALKRYLEETYFKRELAAELRNEGDRIVTDLINFFKTPEGQQIIRDALKD